jgi:hypothetical protein
MSRIKKENEGNKEQGRKSEEGIIKRILGKKIGGNKTTFSGCQFYSSFRTPLAHLPLLRA